MSLRPTRGLRFAGLGPGDNAEYDAFAGLIPNATGRLAMVDDEAAVRQSILLLIRTAPGERVMRPDYGCPLNRLMFAPNDATTAGLAIHYVREALCRWEPRAEIIWLDANPDPQVPGRLVIELQFRLRRTDRVEMLVIPYDMQGGSL